MNKGIVYILVMMTLLASCVEKISSSTIHYVNSPDQGLPSSVLDALLERQLDVLDIPAVSIAVINNAEVVYHKAMGVTNDDTQVSVDDNSIFESASISKPVFAYFVLKMAEKGVIDLDRPLFYYLEDESMAIDDRYYQVTARMVLSHTTGFPNWRWFDPAPPEMKVNRGDFYIKADPHTFTYSGEGYQYLARVLAHNNFLNMYELANLFEEEVAKPLEMEYAYFAWDDMLYDHKVFGHSNDEVESRSWGGALPHHHSKIFGAAGGLHTEAKSYAQFLIGLMNEEGLYPNSFDEYFDEQVLLPEDHRFYLNENTKAWGLGIAIEEEGEHTYYKHGGNNGGFMSGFLFNMETKNGYVYFVNCDKGKEFGEALRTLLLQESR